MSEAALFKLFVSVAGVNAGNRKYPQHTWLVFLEDHTGRIVWTNMDTKPEGVDGSQSRVLHLAIRVAVDHIPDNSEVLLFAPQEEVWHIYRVSREQRRQEDYRGSDKKRRKQADIIRDTDDETERRGITLAARAVELHDEAFRLKEVRQGAQDRWEALRDTYNTDF
ncbi:MULTISPECIES: hypothetical protein [unclassified Sinorhizobium]|uniref:hypothetical protein n=1 Tax=unclassified Sinorhizobium TaxID=2613772 RepID=UPI003523B594